MFQCKAIFVLFVTKVIMEVTCDERVTVNKCCTFNKVIDVSIKKCRASGDVRWSPTFYVNTESDLTKTVDYDIVTGIPSCPGSGLHVLPLRDLVQLQTEAAQFRLLSTGQMKGKHVDGSWIDLPDNYCIDGLQNFDDNSPTSSYSGMEMDQAVLLCPIVS